MKLSAAWIMLSFLFALSQAGTRVDAFTNSAVCVFLGHFSLSVHFLRRRYETEDRTAR